MSITGIIVEMLYFVCDHFMVVDFLPFGCLPTYITRVGHHMSGLVVISSVPIYVVQL